MKEKRIEIRIEKEYADLFKTICEEKGSTVSEELRKHIVECIIDYSTKD